MRKDSATNNPYAVDRLVVNRVVRACVLGLGLVDRRRQDVEDARGDASYEMTQELWIASPDARRAMCISFLLVLGVGAVVLCGTSSPDRCVRSCHTYCPSSGLSRVGVSWVDSEGSEEALRLGCILSHAPREARWLRRAIPTAVELRFPPPTSASRARPSEVNDDVLPRWSTAQDFVDDSTSLNASHYLVRRIEVEGGSLSPPFAPDATEYAVQLPDREYDDVETLRIQVRAARLARRVAVYAGGRRWDALFLRELTNAGRSTPVGVGSAHAGVCPRSRAWPV
jgi:hypothetical protein